MRRSKTKGAFLRKFFIEGSACVMPHVLLANKIIIHTHMTQRTHTLLTVITGLE